MEELSSIFNRESVTQGIIHLLDQFNFDGKTRDQQLEDHKSILSTNSSDSQGYEGVKVFTLLSFSFKDAMHWWILLI
jgi:hypothetical protein